MSFRELAELVGILGDALGVVIIAVGTIAALGRVGLRAYQGRAGAVPAGSR